MESTNVKIVKGFIKLMFYKDPAEVSVESRGNGTYRTHHKDENGKVWKVEFKLKPDGSVRWRQVGGRWRDDKEHDTFLNYSIKNNVATLTDRFYREEPFAELEITL